MNKRENLCNFIFKISAVDPPFPCLIAYRNGAFSHHNNLRLVHNVSELSEEPALTLSAQSFANTLSLAQIAHSPTSNGENLAWSSSSKKQNLEPFNCYAIGVRVSQRWYDEIKLYDFNEPGFRFETSHFTQMVWADVESVGFGLSISEDGKSYFAVAHYSPMGNIKGVFAENVKRPVNA